MEKCLAAVLCAMFFINSYASPGRSAVESFYAQYAERCERTDGFATDERGMYVAAYPQFAISELRAKGLNPERIHLGLRAFTKWAVVSSTLTETTVVAIFSKYLSSPPENPDIVVGAVWTFETKNIPGSGWKIRANSKSGGAIEYKNDTILSWRSYVAGGYKEKIELVYSGERDVRQSSGVRRDGAAAGSAGTAAYSGSSDPVAFTVVKRWSGGVNGVREQSYVRCDSGRKRGEEFKVWLHDSGYWSSPGNTSTYKALHEVMNSVCS